MSTRRIRLVVAYDGTDFRGWAAQPGLRTVQGTLTEAVRRISGEDCEIVGASRTDSGAHAQGQVCHFDCAVPVPVENWVGALNRVLPTDLKVREARRVAPDFHSRFFALDRTYRYTFFTGAPDPRKNRFAFHLARTPSLTLMRRAARLLVGEHDFKAFTEELDSSVENTWRTVFWTSVWIRNGDWNLDVRGTAFLKGMMRRIAGFVMEVGLGKRPPEDALRLLDPQARDSLTWPVVLPARGLTLMRVRYGPHPKDVRLPPENGD